MSRSRSVATMVGRRLAPKVAGAAPGLTETFVREALERAIRGVGPLPGAAAAAEAQLREQDGDADRAVHEVIENHVRYAGAQGFLTNIGGVVTAAVAIPANITGLALVQCRMIAGIAHLRGYDLDDPRVRNAVLACLLGADLIARMTGKRLAVTVGRRVPVVGGVVGMGADGYTTWRIGRYADRELLPRATR